MKDRRGFLFVAFCLAGVFFASGLWADQGGKPIKAMEIFLSNFTELGFMNVRTEEMAQAASYPDLVRFGVGHNYVNNFRSRIEILPEGASEHGDARIRARWVEESVRKYFGLSIKADRSVDQSDPPYFFDGTFFYFWAADGEAPWHARIKGASGPEKGLWELSGEVYNADDAEEILGDFRATIGETLREGKVTYVLVSFETDDAD